MRILATGREARPTFSMNSEKAGLPSSWTISAQARKKSKDTPRLTYCLPLSISLPLFGSSPLSPFSHCRSVGLPPRDPKTAGRSFQVISRPTSLLYLCPTHPPSTAAHAYKYQQLQRGHSSNSWRRINRPLVVFLIL